MGKKRRKYGEVRYKLMENPGEYIRQRPQLAKQLIGLNLPELEKLIQQALALDEQRKKEAEKRKIRVNKKGAGRSKKLSCRR